MAVATFSTYINIYFNGIGFSIRQIGMLAAIGPAISLVAQPVWGILSDRTNRRRVLMIVIAGSAVASILYSFTTTFVLIALVAMFFHACNTAIGPLGDAITLKFLKTRPTIKFSSIRLVGTVSYALMAAAVGYALTGNVGLIFFINAFILVLTLLMVIWMKDMDEPRDAKDKVKEEKASILQLFQNKMLVCVFLASFIFGLTLSFHHSFVGLRLQELGADTGQIGFSMFVAAASEIPVLLFINRMFGNKKPVYILMFTGLAIGLRMFMVYAGTDVFIINLSQLLNGFTFMVPYYFSVLLLDQYAPDGLKSSAQTVYTVFRGGAAALLGNIGGGFMADVFGISRVYLVLAVVAVGTCFVLPGVMLVWFYITRKK
jgi:PPP family 3-phenylpropionic acid transporter